MEKFNGGKNILLLNTGKDWLKFVYKSNISYNNTIINSNKSIPDRAKADYMKTCLLKYSTILTTFIHIGILFITSSFSKYLQTNKWIF